VTDKQTLGSLVSEVTQDLSTLVRGEIELAKTELRESAKSAATGTGLFVGAAVVATFAVFFLIFTLAYVLVQLGLPTWAGFGIVTLLLLIVAAVLVLVGKKQYESVKGTERSTASIAKSKAVLSRKPLDASTPLDAA
jgi:ABC-type multidrug transport system fused ATPase/permease subunit